MTNNRQRTITEVDFDRRFDAFRDAAAGGGTPDGWKAPHDAASEGNLVPYRVPEARAEGKNMQDGTRDRIDRALRKLRVQ